MANPSSTNPPGTIGNCATGYTQAEFNTPFLPQTFDIQFVVGSSTLNEVCSTNQDASGASVRGSNDPNQITKITCAVPLS